MVFRSRVKQRCVLKTIKVAALILEDLQGRVLIGKRREGDTNEGKWEFPGGKVFLEETPEQALVREIKEELGIDIDGWSFFERVNYAYPNRTVEIDFYYTKIEQLPKLEMNAHQALEWVAKKELTRYCFLEANESVVFRLCQDLD